MSTPQPLPDVHLAALHCLLQTDPQQKVITTHELYARWINGELEAQEGTPERLETPGRPERPELVAPRELSKRSPFTEEGKAALIHSLAHIEFNAINLALDAVYRFRGLSNDYYRDWLQVAKEEAYHFDLLSRHLETLGYYYGDFKAHNGLWEMALETDHDVLVRMALVPRVMEARGLDVTPMIMDKLEKAGDPKAIEILKIIQRDEVGHVEIGTKWYRYFCESRKLPPLDTFKELLEKHLKGGVRGPYDIAMRKLAGFTQEELDYLEQVDSR